MPEHPEYRPYPGGLYGQRVIVRIVRHQRGQMETLYDGVSTDINQTEYRRLNGLPSIRYSNSSRAQPGDMIQLLVRIGSTPASRFKLEGSRIALRCRSLRRIYPNAPPGAKLTVDTQSGEPYESRLFIITQSDMTGFEAFDSRNILAIVWQYVVPNGIELSFEQDNREQYIEGRLMSQASVELPPGDDGNWPMEIPKPKAPPEKLPLRKLLIKNREVSP